MERKGVYHSLVLAQQLKEKQVSSPTHTMCLNQKSYSLGITYPLGCVIRRVPATGETVARGKSDSCTHNGRELEQCGGGTAARQLLFLAHHEPQRPRMDVFIGIVLRFLFPSLCFLFLIDVNFSRWGAFAPSCWV